MRADTGWCCPKAFHSKIVYDHTVRDRLSAELGSRSEEWAFRRFLRASWKRLPFTRRPPK